MADPPRTASSAISSAISDDGNSSWPQAAINQPPSALQAGPAQHGYTHIYGHPQSSGQTIKSSPEGGRSTATSSRPHSLTSQVSRTHVPSLTAHGFFRPMSSQRLQAQRAGRQSMRSTGLPAPADDVAGEAETETRRSVSTIRQGPTATMPEHERAPPSRGTEFTDPVLPDHHTNASPTGNATARSLGDSVRLLYERSANEQSHPRPKPQHLSLGDKYKSGIFQDPPQKSPHSFRSSINFGSKRNSRQQTKTGHQHLSSNTTSPRDDVAKVSLPGALEHQYGSKDLGNLSTGKNYEYFEGNTIFWWGGRLQNARDRPINVATAVFFIVPAILFFVFSAPWLWHHVSPAIPILFGYLFYICLSSFLHASTVDPGVFPRNSHPFPPTDFTEDPLSIGPPTNDWVMIRLATSKTAAMDVPVKYCKTCNIWRPPRCYHCRVCDNCVETLDHHCVWLNNCVGRRNYRYFFAFVGTEFVLGLFLTFASLGHCLAYRSQNGLTFAQAIDKLRTPFAMFIYGVLATPYPASLFGYHLFLMGRGETTREYLNSHKFVKADRHRPFTLGNFLKNWIAVLGRPRPATYVHFKREYEEGDQRFGSRKGGRQAPLVAEAQGGGMEMKPVQGPPKPFEGPGNRTPTPTEAQ